uniref:Uncharacterized protein n=1 Tax=Hyaloperonospora arabidopsidis (strain Emoy2) TaxID=559515 RepID=M4B296_HYAAE
MGDFPPKERGPVSWLPGGSRLYPLLQLAADWEVLGRTLVSRQKRSLARLRPQSTRPSIQLFAAFCRFFSFHECLKGVSHMIGA